MAETGATVELGELEQRIEAKRKEWSERAKALKPPVFRFGLAAAVLGPAAVLALTIQILAFKPRSPVAVGLIALELLLLFTVLLLGFTQLWPSPEKWAKARLRAELLRRERFLLRARVGPYLDGGPSAALATTVEARLRRIGEPAIAEPLDLLPLEDRSGQPWRDQLEDHQGDGAAVSPRDCCQWYLEQRVHDQKQYYHDQGETSGHRDEVLDSLAKISLWCAFGLAAAHLVALLTVSQTEGGGEPTLPLLIEIAAIALPPIGSGIAAVQSFCHFRLLRRAYRDRAELLARLASRFEEVVAECQQEGAGEQAALGKQLKRLVLTTEELLSGELRQWYLMMVDTQFQV